MQSQIYVQKVKHLEYEHKNNLAAVAQDGLKLRANESEVHLEKYALLSCDALLAYNCEVFLFMQYAVFYSLFLLRLLSIP